MLERACGQRALQSHYQGLKARPQDHFFEEALMRLRVQPEFQGPGHGAGALAEPTAFVANHPFVIVDGLVLCAYAKARFGASAFCCTRGCARTGTYSAISARGLH